VKREFVAETFAAQDSALSLRVEQLRDIEGVRAQEAEQAKAALHTARTLASLVERRTGRSQARTQHLTGEPAHQTRVQQLAAGRRAAAALPAVDARARLLQEINGLQQQHGKDAGELVVAAQVRDALRPAHVELPIRDAAQQEAKGSIGKQKERLEALAALVKARGEAARLAGEETSATAKAAEGQGAVELAQAALAALDAVGEASRQAQGALQAGRDRVEGCRRFETDAKAVRVWTDTRSPALAKELEQEQRVLGEREQDLTRAEQTLTDAQHRVDADAALALAANLRPDEPCPVCGSTDHPQPRHRSGDEVRDDALALRKTADALVKSARTGHEVQGKLVATVQATRITEKTAAEAAANRLRDAGFQGPEAWQVALAAAMADLAPLDGAEQERQVALAGRPNRAQALEWARQTADQRRTAAEQAAQRRTVATTTLQGLGERLGPVADAAVETLATQQAIRQAETAFDTETQAILKLRNDMQQAEARVSTLAGQVDALAKQLQAKRNDLPTTQQAAEKALADAQFDTEQAARACALTAAVLDTLQRQVEQWTLELAQLDTQLADLEREIDGRPAPDLVTAQQLAEQCATVATQAAEDRLAVASEQDQLRAKDKRFRELEEERRLLVADSRGLLDLSQRLNGEIAPKIDFATWMLTWWLDRVLRAANSRLRTLSDSRYAFRLRTGQTDGRVCAGLDVDVLDTWSNRLRDVNALSGGEKFLASLSLALGLADVVQSLNGGVQLDTLFIDEGFGSLDAETLGRAMELIEALSEHRSVGLISHVEAMQREIPSQVRVTKSPAGSKVTVVRSAKAYGRDVRVEPQTDAQHFGRRLIRDVTRGNLLRLCLRPRVEVQRVRVVVAVEVEAHARHPLYRLAHPVQPAHVAGHRDRHLYPSQRAGPHAAGRALRVLLALLDGRQPRGLQRLAQHRLHRGNIGQRLTFVRLALTHRSRAHLLAKRPGLAQLHGQFGLVGQLRARGTGAARGAARRHLDPQPVQTVAVDLDALEQFASACSRRRHRRAPGPQFVAALDPV
jgi:exonuclease SbcC